MWAGALESDGLNRLVLGAGLAWREVAILRAYAKYLRQAGIAFSQDYMERALVAYPAIARLMVDLFVARFDPALGEASSDARKQRVDALEDKLAAALERVTTLDEDRILRRFLNAVRCTLRTNYWQTGRTAGPRNGSPSRSTAAPSTSCRRRGRWSRSSSTARAWRASICAAAGWRAAASAGPTGARISAPRSWA